MTKRKARKPLKKEEVAEDYCFVCKDGGVLRICDYKQCLKAYHFDCVGKDESFLENEQNWTCGWHSCFICSKASEFHCYCCPKAVCLRCILKAEFVNFKGKNGFCKICLKLALLLEQGTDIDSEGEKVDFDDCETIEGLFKEYYMIIKEKEGFNVDSLRAAKDRLKTGKNLLSHSDSEFDDDEDEGIISDYDGVDHINDYKPTPKKKEFKAKLSAASENGKSKGMHFCGWGSIPLVKFLKEIGRDTQQKMSQADVIFMINSYIKDHNLNHPVKKRKIVCDEKLRSIFRKKTLNKNSISKLLQAHFAENFEESEEEEVLCYSGDDDFVQDCAMRKKSKSDKACPREEAICSVSPSTYASISKHNVNLVYLRRSLVQELSKHPTSFESKIIGSFVRVKTDPDDFWQKNSHQLVQVTGVKEVSTTGDKSEINLYVTNVEKEVSISLLSDADFPEEECQDLWQRVKEGVFLQPTVVELQKKARILHQDITKDWIARELKKLDLQIDQANEKGWRREFFIFLERKKSLQSLSEQSRLLVTYPTVIPEQTEDQAAGEAGNEGKCNEASPLSNVSTDLNDKMEGNETSDDAEKHTPAPVDEKPVAAYQTSTRIQSCTQNEKKSSLNEEHSQQILTPAAPDEETKATSHCVAAVHSPPVGSMKQNQQCDVKPKKSNKQEPLAKQVVTELNSSDDEKRQSSGPVDEKPVASYQTSTRIQSCTQNKKKSSLNVEHSQQILTPAPGEETKATSHCDAAINQQSNVKPKKSNKQEPLAEQVVIELNSSDDEKHESSGTTVEFEDPERKVWMVLGPDGKTRGPYPLSALKRLIAASDYARKVKAWKENQSERDAISLEEAMNLAFPAAADA